VEPRVTFITLGVPDLDAARRFYVDGLGWEPALDVPGEVIFIQVGHGLLLALFDAGKMAADIGAGAPVAPTAGIALAHNVGTEAEVVQAIDRAAAAGATVLKPAQATTWGGHHGYFADPAGFVWEVAHNPGWRVEPDGRVAIGGG
jgi:catechol 2,3-dioxygenase-like lactoylglutathione lyase family enzyme